MPNWLNKSLLLLFTGSFAVYANLTLAFIVMPLYILDIGGSEWTAAWHNALLAASAVIGRFLLVGWIGRSKRTTCILLSGTALVVAPLLILLVDSWEALAVIRLLQGFGLALYPPAGNALVADLSPKERRGTALGLMRLVMISALVTGPLMAGFIVDAYGFKELFFGMGVFGLLGVAVLALIKEPQKRWAEMAGIPSFRAVFASRTVRVLFPSILACGLAYSVLLTFLPAYVLDLGADNFGSFFTLFALSGLLAAVIAGRLSDAFGRKVVLIPALLLYGVGVAALSIATPGLSMILVSIIAGLGYAASLTILVAWLIDEAGTNLRAASLSLFDTGVDIGVTLGSITFGSVIALFGYETGFLLTGLVILAFALLLLSARARMVPGSE